MNRLTDKDTIGKSVPAVDAATKEEVATMTMLSNVMDDANYMLRCGVFIKNGRILAVVFDGKCRVKTNLTEEDLVHEREFSKQICSIIAEAFSEAPNEPMVVYFPEPPKK